MKNSTLYISLILLSTACIGIQAVAESNYNPYANNTLNFGNSPLGAGAWQNSLIGAVDPNNPNEIAAPIFNGLRQDENQVVYDQMNGVSGREYKTNDAEKQGNAGNIAAIITGSALVGTGTPMLFSASLPVVIAGAQLVAMGGMEFAQAGADAGASTANKAQTDNLMGRNPYDKPLPTANQFKEQLNTPEMNKLLSDRGINAEDFIENLTSGNLQTPEAILNAIGAQHDFSPEDLSAGSLLAQQEFGKISGNMGTARLGANEGSESIAGGGMGGSPFTGIGGNPGQTNKDGMEGTTDTQGAKVALGKAIGSFNGEAFGGGELPAAGLSKTGIDPQTVVNNIFGKNNQVAPAAPVMDLNMRMTYMNVGVQRTVKGQTIFSLARRTFKTFNKYRKPTKTSSVTQPNRS